MTQLCEPLPSEQYNPELRLSETTAAGWWIGLSLGAVTGAIIGTQEGWQLYTEAVQSFDHLSIGIEHGAKAGLAYLTIGGGYVIGAVSGFVGGMAAGAAVGAVSHPIIKYGIGPVSNAGKGLADVVAREINRFTHRNSDDSPLD